MQNQRDTKADPPRDPMSSTKDETGAAADRNPTPKQTIEKATSSVPLEALSKKGFKNVRVLSETKFLDLLRSLVESSFQKRFEEWKGRLSDAEEPEKQRLERKHKESLRSVERQMAKLSRVFEGLEETFKRLEAEPSTERTSVPLLPVSTLPRPGEEKKTALLREMLLKKGE